MQRDRIGQIQHQIHLHVRKQIKTKQTADPKRLSEPDPDPFELDLMLETSLFEHLERVEKLVRLVLVDEPGSVVHVQA